MTIRISLVTVLAALALAAIGAGSAVGVMLWEPWDGNDEGTNDVAAPSSSPTAENTFSMTAETRDDIELAVNQIGAFMPDFDCASQWIVNLNSGNIDCGAGVTGFICTAVTTPKPICREKEHLAPEFPQCSVEGTAGRYLIQCTGPNTNTACTVRGREITCQRP